MAATTMRNVPFFRGVIASSNNFPCSSHTQEIKPVITNILYINVCTPIGDKFESTPANENETTTQVKVNVIKANGLMKLRQMACSKDQTSVEYTADEFGSAYVHLLNEEQEDVWNASEWTQNGPTYSRFLIGIASTNQSASLEFTTESTQIVGVSLKVLRLITEDVETEYAYTASECQFNFMD